jgi:hypothetical protein
VTPEAPVPGLEPAFAVDARLGPLEDHGLTRAGHRRVVPVTGGRVSGLPGAEIPLDAEIMPGGADWQVVALLERSVFVASAIRGTDSVAYTAYRVT